MPFPAHPLTFCLHATRELLQARSVARFGKTLHVLMPPHQQMMGTLVSEVAVVRAPDGVQLRLTHHTGYVERPMEPDWSVADKAPAKAYDEAAVLALVEAQIATTGAILYARSTCPYCEQAKAALTAPLPGTRDCSTRDCVCSTRYVARTICGPKAARAHGCGGRRSAREWRVTRGLSEGHSSAPRSRRRWRVSKRAAPQGSPDD